MSVSATAPCYGCIVVAFISCAGLSFLATHLGSKGFELSAKCHRCREHSIEILHTCSKHDREFPYAGKDHQGDPQGLPRSYAMASTVVKAMDYKA